MNDHDQQGKKSGIVRLLRYALPYRGLIVAIIALMVFYSAANSLRLAAVGLVIDGVVSPSGDGQRGRTITLFEDYVLPWLPGDVELPHQRKEVFQIQRAQLVGDIGARSGSTAMSLEDGFVVDADLVSGGVLQSLAGSRIEIKGGVIGEFRRLTDEERERFGLDSQPLEEVPTTAVLS
ncbi:MAG: hypothetical protein AAEJ65_00140, partial [Planctomycetota bacterium]